MADSQFLRSGQAANDPEFKLRIQACLFKLAQNVINESPSTDNHVLRLQLARRVIANPELLAGQFIWLCASNPTIAGTVSVENLDVQVGAPDGDIEFVCSSNWDVVSGWGMGDPLGGGY